MESYFNIKDSVILITGSTGYLGRNIVTELSKMSVTLIIHGRNMSKLEDLQRVVAKNGSTCHITQFDLLDEKSISEELTKLPFDKIDCIINNACQNSPNPDYLNATHDDFMGCYTSGLIAPYNIIKNLLSRLRRSDNPSVINISSMYGLVSPNPEIYGNSGNNNPIGYGPTKSALIQLTKYLACHIPDIRFNTISPGPFPNETVMDNKEFVQQLSQKTPMKRVGKPSELIGPIILLISRASSYMTGTNIVVDGGWTVW